MAGWLSAVNICESQYLTEEAVTDYLRRAEAAEFTK
jgi:hypothetical protein